VIDIATGERYRNVDITDNADFLGWLHFEIISSGRSFGIREWLGQGMFIHLDDTFLSAEEALDWIHQKGGALSKKGTTGSAAA
jgi:hypothetical protein